ncbi:cysteine desulfurase NifS [Acidobacteria bacterium AH-259-D05]|nr:cysteine desulfurase NifS [Acidobacteria bacterium AH-259-D05]
MRKVYFDNNATTPLDPAVFEAMRVYYLEDYGNAASIHGYGQKARSAVEDARCQVADLIGAQTSEIVFTSGGTESDNTALRGVAMAHRSKGNHIITTTIEHSAILHSCQELEKEGFRVSCLRVDRRGLLSLDRLQEAMDEDTILISVMHGNNEIGVIEPIREIAALARERDILFHTDAVQTVGKIPLQVEDLGVDLLSLSAHKFHGPKGVGALYVRSGVQMLPLLHGGSHERSRRAGTLNVPGIVGLGKTCELAKEALEDFGTRVQALRDRLEEGILEQVPETFVNGSKTERVPHLSNISFRLIDGEALLIALDFQGIAVSTGSACASGTVEPSHVLSALGGDRDLHKSAIRFSLSRMNGDDDIQYVLSILPELVERIRQVSPLYRTGVK